jgi:hypothetical protein
MTNDRFGIFASQVIRLIGNVYSQTMRVYICGERRLSYQSDLKTPSKLRFANDRFRSLAVLLAESKSDNLVAKISSI